MIPIASVIGSAAAFFLWSLNLATDTRWHYPWLLFLLPVAGLAVGALYHRLGRSVEGGNNLIMDQIHEAGGGVPARMAPLVLIATVLTHLFGGSAGREGTAVQMGGSIASLFGRWLRMDAVGMRMLLMAGMAAGFGAVFGTPITGAVFAMEVLAIGRIEYEGLVPCLVASVIGDMTCAAWGITHTHYHIGVGPIVASALASVHVDWLLLAKTAVASIGFGLASVLFAELTHGLQQLFKRFIPAAMMRPVFGGLVVIGLAYLVGTREYIGLGVTSPDPHAVTILSAFGVDGAGPWSWWWKILFTAVTLGSGFKGGEVTPLFFIGACLGNVLAHLLGAPVDLFAGLGFIAVFAGATNTPLACTIMGIELFGSTYAIYFAAACFLSYLLSGHSGIYLSQRIAVPKGGTMSAVPETSLRTAREQRQPVGAAPSDAPRDDTRPSPVHGVHPSEIGQLRIYLARRERRGETGLQKLLGRRPLYRRIIAAAKEEGILNAVMHSSHYGYTRHGTIVGEGVDPNPNLTIHVELIADRELLESFCRKYGDLLAGKVIVYKHMEHWEITPHGVERSESMTEESR